MKVFLWIGVVISGFSLLMDSALLFGSWFNGERIHPQLLDHWPMNLVLVGVFIYFLKRSYKAKL